METKIKAMAWNVYCEDVEEFRNTMLSLPMGENLYQPDETDFRSSAAVAQALEASGAPAVWREKVS